MTEEQTSPKEGPPATAAEPDVEAAAGAPAAAQPDALEQALAQARERAEQNWDALLRARADLDNLRKRHERELQSAHRYGAEALVSELLPVKDGLEQALAAGERAGSASVQALAQLLEGTRMTLGLLEKALARAGAAEVPADGRFDPAVHQAMSVQESAEVADGHVLAVVQKGYLLHDRLVRPAMVVVARAPASGEPSGEAP